MNDEQVARVLKELGHPHRLKVFRRLVRSGHEGLPVGALREELDIPHSTMTHHISALAGAGLIVQERRGRILQCIPQFDLLDAVTGFLVEECCLDKKESGNS